MISKDYDLVYTYGGSVAHVVSYGSMPDTLCDLNVSSFMLFGTGSKREYDKAHSLPICKNCKSKNTYYDLGE